MRTHEFKNTFGNGDMYSSIYNSVTHTGNLSIYHQVIEHQARSGMRNIYWLQGLLGEISWRGGRNELNDLKDSIRYTEKLANDPDEGNIMRKWNWDIRRLTCIWGYKDTALTLSLLVLPFSSRIVNAMEIENNRNSCFMTNGPGHKEMSLSTDTVHTRYNHLQPVSHSAVLDSN